MKMESAIFNNFDSVIKISPQQGDILWITMKTPGDGSLYFDLDEIKSLIKGLDALLEHKDISYVILPDLLLLNSVQDYEKAIKNLDGLISKATEMKKDLESRNVKKGYFLDAAGVAQ